MISMNDLISVIIPVYNVEKFLPNTIDAIIQQDYPYYEIILIDDGSKDRSGEICDEYANKYSNVKAFHQINKGVSSARNVGIDKSNGKYIAFVDADDIVKPSYLSRMYHDLKIKQCDFVVQMYNNIFTDGSIRRSVHDDVDTNMDGLEFIEFEIAEGRDTTIYAKLYKKKIIKKYNVRFREEIANLEDMLFLFDYAKHCKYVYYNSITNYNRICRKDSFVFSKFDEKKLTGLKSFQIIYSSLKSMNVDKKFLDKFESNYFRNLIFYTLECQQKDELTKYVDNMIDESRKIMSHNSHLRLKDKIKFYFICMNPCIIKYVYKTLRCIKESIYRKKLA